MKASALIPLIFFVSAGSAQAAERPGPTEPPTSHFQGACDSDPDGKKFAEKACYTTYNPGKASFGASYRRPVCDKSAITDRQKEILAKTYVRAPDYMKAKLCRLTQLFVTHSYHGAWESWGFWEGAYRPPGTAVYVAISDRDLASEQSFAAAENQTVDALLRRADHRRRAVRRLVGLRTDAPADPELTVLGVLAHELGHALLADTNADGTDPRHPRRAVSGPPRSKCFDEAFLRASWDPDRFHQNMRLWVEFGDPHHNRPVNPDVGLNLDRLRKEVRRGKLNGANEAIADVYRSKQFMSVFAAISPEEDIVETYKYKVLADAAQKPSVIFRLRGREVNVLDYLDSDGPAKKVECLRDLGFLTSQ